MGGLCCCLQSSDEQHQHGQEATPRTPLLAGIGSRPHTESNGKSARVYPTEKQQFLTSLEELTPVSCNKIVLPLLDKTFQDHSKLYNDLLNSFNALRQTMDDMKLLAATEEHTEMPSLQACVQSLVSQCGEADLKVKRSKYCIQIEYNAKEVSEKATVAAEDAIEMLQLYNKYNKLCKDILDKSPQIKLSIEIILEDEKGLRLEVMKSNLDGTEAPEAMKNCITNINKFRHLPGAIETIQRHTERTFNNIKEASKVLFTRS